MGITEPTVAPIPNWTSGIADRPGLLHSALSGILFLDEIGQLALDELAMILRAAVEGRFLPVGADKDVESDFQLIAGTNPDLLAEVAAGCLRDDLFDRVQLAEVIRVSRASRSLSAAGRALFAASLR